MHQVGHELELRRDARSTKHKTVDKLVYFISRGHPVVFKHNIKMKENIYFVHSIKYYCVPPINSYNYNNCSIITIYVRTILMLNLPQTTQLQQTLIVRNYTTANGIA